jgi:transcriptional regulator GlxA family with amidase domain
MTQSMKVFLVVFPGFELLDMAGPSSVFSTANYRLGYTAYQPITVSTQGGLITSYEGVKLCTQSIHCCEVTAVDTVVVTGGLKDALRSARQDDELLEWLRCSYQSGARIASVCTGSFVLAESGIAKGKTVATHWIACDEFRLDFPDITLDDEAIYRCEGQVWSSAGVSSGIDMALAMIEADHDHELKTYVSRALVVYAHRPGFQTQFSELLQAQSKSGNHFDDTIDWINHHLAEPIRVEELAARVNMSERNFFRKFLAAFGMTPAKFIEQARMVRARDLLLTPMPIKQVVAATGYRSEAAFRTAFERRFGTTPSGFREIHGKSPPPRDNVIRGTGK